MLNVLKRYNIQYDGVSPFKIMCPFHADKNPSLLIDIEKGSWFCFGCNEGGDAIAFIQKMEKCNALEAYKIYGGSLPASAQVSPKPEVNNMRLWLLSKQYYECLEYILLGDGSDASIYLEGRGIHQSVLDKLGAKATYNLNYPVCFPIMQNGVFKGYVKRTTSKQYEIDTGRKYLYNKGFHRANCLCGFWTKGCNVLVIVEGYFDMLKAIQAGEKNVVALLGWKASAYHLKKIARIGAKHIIAATDNDECGKKGFKFLKYKLDNVVRFIYEPQQKDIGDLSKLEYITQKRRTLEYGCKFFR